MILINYIETMIFAYLVLTNQKKNQHSKLERITYAYRVTFEGS